MNSSRKTSATQLNETARVLRLLRMACGLSCEEAAQAFKLPEQDIRSFETGAASAPASYLLALQFVKEQSETTNHSGENEGSDLDADISALTKAFCNIKDVALRKSLVAVVKAASTPPFS